MKRFVYVFCRFHLKNEWPARFNYELINAETPEEVYAKGLALMMGSHPPAAGWDFNDYVVEI